MRRRWRWLVVAALVALLVATPSIVANWPARAAAVDASDLLARVRGSGAEAYQGYVEARGGLRLPDIDRTNDLAALFGGSSNLRVWFRSKDSFRVDSISATGETDTYGDATGISTWNSNRRFTQRSQGVFQLRLARTSDLLPPELGRRLANAVTDTTGVQSIGAARVAGRVLPGLRLTPNDATSTIDHVDLWADAAHGLVARVQVVAKGFGEPVLETQFLELSMTAPNPSLTTFTPPKGTFVDRDDDGLDIVQLLEKNSPIPLPATLAGLARRTPQSKAAASYGEGFGIIDIGAVPASVLTRALPDTIPTSARSWGTARVIETPLLNAMGFVVGPIAYVVSGPVTLAELDRVATAMNPVAS